MPDKITRCVRCTEITTSYLMHGLKESFIVKDWNINDQQVKALVSRIVKSAIAKGNIDDLMQKESASWLARGADQEKEFVEREYGTNGIKLYAATEDHTQMIHYMLLSALFNYKRHKEDIKAFACEQIIEHLRAKNLLIDPTTKFNGFKYIDAGIILLLKLFLEQDLLPLVIALESGVTDFSAYKSHDIGVVRNLWQLFKEHSQDTETLRQNAADLLKSFQDFKESPLDYKAFVQAQLNSVNWNWLTVSVAFIVSLALLVFLKMLLF